MTSRYVRADLHIAEFAEATPPSSRTSCAPPKGMGTVADPRPLWRWRSSRSTPLATRHTSPRVDLPLAAGDGGDARVDTEGDPVGLVDPGCSRQYGITSSRRVTRQRPTSSRRSTPAAAAPTPTATSSGRDAAEHNGRLTHARQVHGWRPRGLHDRTSPTRSPGRRGRVGAPPLNRLDLLQHRPLVRGAAPHVAGMDVVGVVSDRR